MKPPTPELRALIDRLFDGEPLTRPQMARLEEMLEDDENLACYLELTQQEAAMPELLAETSSVVMPARQGYLWTTVALMVAACLVFLIGWWTGHRQTAVETSVSQVPEFDGPAAQITGLMGVRWSSSDYPDLLGRSGALGALMIESGLVEITYASGVRLTIEGPAHFDVTDHESGRLFNGKLVASVPKGAEGFRVDYAEGSIIDLGTEFAMAVGEDGATEVGVFDGEIELRASGAEPMSLFESHAVRHDHRDVEDPVQPIPFQRGKFVRRIPTRDFAWEISSSATEELVFDVSHLVWKASEYRAIFKWINGVDAVVIENVELRLDGQTVATDPHSGATGLLEIVRDNVFSLNLPEDRYTSGHWTLHATLRPYPRINTLQHYSGPVSSSGILQFEEGLVSNAVAEDFIGRWSYHHLGSQFIREFHPDGTVSLSRDGGLLKNEFVGSRWTLEQGTLHVSIPARNAAESHILRDFHTLVFISNPYENAVRLED